MRRLNITGERYGKLTALYRLEGKISRWVLQCDCGNRTEVLLSNLRGNQVKSCGCAGSRTTMGIRALKHGHSIGFKKSRTSMAWRNAKTRCFNKKNNKYGQYGGRGITMCKEWAHSFEAFLRDMGECPDGLTLERDDVNGNYEPGNCRWAPWQDQYLNKQNSIKIDGSPLKEIVQSMGLCYKSVHRRIRLYGETPDQALQWYIDKNRKRTSMRVNTGDFVEIVSRSALSGARHDSVEV